MPRTLQEARLLLLHHGDKGAARRQFRNIVGAGDYTLFAALVNEPDGTVFFQKMFIVASCVLSIRCCRIERGPPARSGNKAAARNQRLPPPERSPAQLA